MSRLTVLLCALTLATTACAQGLTNPGMVAEINGDRISLSDLESQVDVYLGATNPQTGEGPTPEQATDQAVFQTTLATLLDQVIDQRGGDPVTEEDIDALLAQTIVESGGEQAFNTGLASQGLTPEAFRLGQQVGLRVERLQGLLIPDIQVSDEEIQAAYDAQYSEPTVAHILVATQPEAQAVLDRLESGESFGEVAMDVSTDPGSGPNGGDLGPLQIGAFVPEFEEAALALQPGQISDPVQTQFGFHVITVNDPPPLSEVRDQLQEALQAQQVGPGLVSAVEQAFTDADVTVNPRFGVWDPAFTDDGGLNLIVPTDPLGELVPAGAGGIAPNPLDPLAPAVEPPAGGQG